MTERYSVNPCTCGSAGPLPPQLTAGRLYCSVNRDPLTDEANKNMDPDKKPAADLEYGRRQSALGYRDDRRRKYGCAAGHRTANGALCCCTMHNKAALHTETEVEAEADTETETENDGGKDDGRVGKTVGADGAPDRVRLIGYVWCLVVRHHITASNQRRLINSYIAAFVTKPTTSRHFCTRPGPAPALLPYSIYGFCRRRRPALNRRRQSRTSPQFVEIQYAQKCDVSFSFVRLKALNLMYHRAFIAPGNTVRRRTAARQPLGRCRLRYVPCENIMGKNDPQQPSSFVRSVVPPLVRRRSDSQRKQTSRLVASSLPYHW
ncbi:unnamed protein product [Soboliphyme baturini]|uniref:Uncharacterized protein n=1 Tax=Soboliphyme baturini TaxID=241478 RepID=A0A183J5I1_9BILA|nr:unnamed protein product [Soboliphyme baturini]